jgi:hypothetical protein
MSNYALVAALTVVQEEESKVLVNEIIGVFSSKVKALDAKDNALGNLIGKMERQHLLTFTYSLTIETSSLPLKETVDNVYFKQCTKNVISRIILENSQETVSNPETDKPINVKEEKLVSSTYLTTEATETKKRGREAKWTKETIPSEASKYKTKTELFKNNPSAYMAANRLGLLDSLYPKKVG